MWTRLNSPELCAISLISVWARDIIACTWRKYLWENESKYYFDRVSCCPVGVSLPLRFSLRHTTKKVATFRISYSSVDNNNCANLFYERERAAEKSSSEKRRRQQTWQVRARERESFFQQTFEQATRAHETTVIDRPSGQINSLESFARENKRELVEYSIRECDYFTTIFSSTVSVAVQVSIAKAAKNLIERIRV